MAIKLNLKLRKGGSRVIELDRALAKANVDAAQDGSNSQHAKLLQESKDTLWREVCALLEMGVVHDKHWLEMIINWVPAGRELPNGREPGLLPVTEMARWYKLAARVDALDNKREGTFTLSDTQARLVFERVTDKRFELTGLTGIGLFLTDFFTAYGKWPEGHSTEDDFDAEFESDDAITQDQTGEDKP